jgi:hypothetical protein
LWEKKTDFFHCGRIKLRHKVFYLCTVDAGQYLSRLLEYVPGGLFCTIFVCGALIFTVPIP